MKYLKKRLRIVSLLVLMFFTLGVVSSLCGNIKQKSSDKDTSTKIVNDISAELLQDLTNKKTIIAINGQIGNSTQWKSGWIDLARPFDFRRGDTLRIEIGGTAKKVLIRLLPVNGDPNSTEGIIGRDHNVNRNGEVIINLNNDYPGIKQISAHGGSNPFGSYPLGQDNGPATVQHVTLIRR